MTHVSPVFPHPAAQRSLAHSTSTPGRSKTLSFSAHSGRGRDDLLCQPRTQPSVCKMPFISFQCLCSQGTLEPSLFFIIFPADKPLGSGMKETHLSLFFFLIIRIVLFFRT